MLTSNSSREFLYHQLVALFFLCKRYRKYVGIKKIMIESFRLEMRPSRSLNPTIKLTYQLPSLNFRTMMKFSHKECINCYVTCKGAFSCVSLYLSKN